MNLKNYVVWALLASQSLLAGSCAFLNPKSKLERKIDNYTENAPDKTNIHQRIDNSGDFNLDLADGETFILGENKKIMIYSPLHVPPKSLKTSLEELLKAENEKNGVFLNESTNQLLISVDKDYLTTKILPLISRMDVELPQIEIEVKMYKVFADKTVDVELNLKGFQTVDQDLKGTLESILPGASLRDLTRKTFGTKFGIVATHESREIEALFDFLESQGYAETVITPTLVTYNNQVATIESLNKVPYPADIITGNVVTKVTKYEEVPTKMTVTPIIMGDGSIFLDLSTEFGRIQPSGSSQIPAIEIKKTNSTLKLYPGQTLKMGGIYTTDSTEIERFVIPIVGKYWPFSYLKSFDYEESTNEIYVLVTPHVLDTKKNSFKSDVESSKLENSISNMQPVFVFPVYIPTQ